MADAKATLTRRRPTLTQRLDAVIQHLRQQRQSNAPISPWVITELETIKTAVVDYEPPPLRDMQQAINRAWDEARAAKAKADSDG